MSIFYLLLSSVHHQFVRCTCYCVYCTQEFHPSFHLAISFVRLEGWKYLLVHQIGNLTIWASSFSVLNPTPFNPTAQLCSISNCYMYATSLIDLTPTLPRSALLCYVLSLLCYHVPYYLCYRVVQLMGFNSVRLPIGYWNLMTDPYRKYAPSNHRTSLKYIDWCFDTCEQVRVLCFDPLPSPLTSIFSDSMIT